MSERSGNTGLTDGPAPASPPGSTGDDSRDLARFGYRQELERSLGSFSSFAAGFSYISIMTGVFQLFGFGFGSGGPAFIWTWPLVFFGQLAVALCFAEMSGQFPLAGGVYQWSKQIARPATSWMSGWIMAIGSIVTAAAVAVAYQIILPQVSLAFQIVGGADDAGLTTTPNGAKNAILLALGLVVFTTVVNLIGVRLMAKINNLGVAVELIGVTLLIVMLAVHIHRGPQVILQTQGTGAGHSWGYLGAFLVASLMSAYVFYGFDTAGSLAEETREPRRHAPRAIVRAITAAFIAGGLLMLVGMMAVGDVNAKELGTLGMPYLIKSTLGTGLGDAFLVCSAIAITVCCLAVQTAAIRLLFAMARDGRLPFGHAIAKVSPRSKTPMVPALLTGALTIGLLLVNIGNQRVFYILTSVAIILFYIPYLMVTAPMLLRRLRGQWPRAEHGTHFNLGRWGTAVNLVAVLYGAAMTVNLAWPRAAVYGSDHWYFQWGAVVFVAVITAVGAGVYLARRGSGRVAEPLPDDGLVGEV
ncbi:amino acid permease [Kitasatospora atroaurantiaca]|uniref:Amino acid/polyamine/organocation transporter (APC superfamily) n=1 Tax=Kitasatospora atroaurantiaca TaxID=285545 RepID=A0A561EI45_9ACTN|nr:amino acid permease [Kitasatospora atroaurantiaca]TWE15286.1 amino acid/polyamine/organocation transporter (APC superfamily) [Kitasatospora atroaurantiaca]